MSDEPAPLILQVPADEYYNQVARNGLIARKVLWLPSSRGPFVHHIEIMHHDQLRNCGKCAKIIMNHGLCSECNTGGKLWCVDVGLVMHPIFVSLAFQKRRSDEQEFANPEIIDGLKAAEIPSSTISDTIEYHLITRQNCIDASMEGTGRLFQIIVVFVVVIVCWHWMMRCGNNIGTKSIA